MWRRFDSEDKKSDRNDGSEPDAGYFGEDCKEVEKE
jgi:hypothetical protein